MQRHCRRCWRGNDRKWRCVGDVEPKVVEGVSAGMGVSKAPVATMRGGHPRVMEMTRFRQRRRAIGTRPRSNGEWQQKLEEQRADRYPGRDAAPNSIAPRLPAPTTVTLHAKHFRCYGAMAQAILGGTIRFQ